MDISNLIISYYGCRSKEEQKIIVFQIKDYLVESGKYNLWCNVNFANHCKYICETYGTGIEIYIEYQLYLGVDLKLSHLELLFCKQIYDANRSRNRRLREKLEYNLENFDCVFLTLTFTDDLLNNTSHQTRRDYIRRYLKSLGSTFYVGNIDFGDKEKNPESKEREHYHAIINLESIDLNSYNYGFIYAERIKKGSNPLVLAKYVNKLTAHAYKDSTKGRDRLIYSR